MSCGALHLVVSYHEHSLVGSAEAVHSLGHVPEGVYIEAGVDLVEDRHLSFEHSELQGEEGKPRWAPIGAGWAPSHVRAAKRGPQTCRISFRFFSPPEKPSLTLRVR